MLLSVTMKILLAYHTNDEVHHHTDDTAHHTRAQTADTGNHTHGTTRRAGSQFGRDAQSCTSIPSVERLISGSCEQLIRCSFAQHISLNPYCRSKGYAQCNPCTPGTPLRTCVHATGVHVTEFSSFTHTSPRRRCVGHVGGLLCVFDPL